MSGFIKESLRKHLNENIKQQEYIKLAVDGGFDVDSAKVHLKNTVNKIKELPNVIKLYRVVFVDDVKQIDNVNVGSHYVDNQRDLEKSHSQASHVGGGKPFILTVNAPKSLLDIDATIKNKMLYPHENELTLKNKGVGSKIVNIEPFESNDNHDDLIGDVGDFDDFGDFDY